MDAYHEGLYALFNQKEHQAKAKAKRKKKKKEPMVFKEEEVVEMLDPNVRKPGGPKYA